MIKKLKFVHFYLFFSVAIIATIILTRVAFSQEAAPVLGDKEIFAQILEQISLLGGAGWMAKVSASCLILVSFMKISFLKPLWDKMGWRKILAAPILSLIAGILILKPITLAGILAYISSGMGAIILHELLDAIKLIPGIGGIALSIVDFLKKALYAPKDNS